MRVDTLNIPMKRGGPELANGVVRWIFSIKGGVVPIAITFTRKYHDVVPLLMTPFPLRQSEFQSVCRAVYRGGVNEVLYQKWGMKVNAGVKVKVWKRED